MIGRKNRIFYFAPVGTDDINAEFGANKSVGAITNKVVGVCNALTAVGRRPIIVAAITPSSKVIKKCHFVYRGAKILVLKTVGSKVFQRINAAWLYLLFAMNAMNRGDIVILYNYFPEYLLAAIYLRITGIRCFLDVEDGPRSDELSFREIVTQVMLPILRVFCDERVLTVSNQLARRLKFMRFLSLYGISNSFAKRSSELGSRLANTKLKVLYGGTIIEDTGLAIFEDCVNILSFNQNVEIEFHVSGRFPSERMSTLEKLALSSKSLSIVIHPNVSADAYNEVLGRCDIGLNLKLSTSQIGATTFPSKVIEYATAGLVLVTTDVSDVVEIFGPDGCYVLEAESGKALADMLVRISNDRSSARQRGANGNAIVLERFSAVSVGHQITRFIDEI